VTLTVVIPAPVLSAGEYVGSCDVETVRAQAMASAAVSREAAALSLRRPREPYSAESSARKNRRRPVSDRSSSALLALLPERRRLLRGPRLASSRTLSLRRRHCKKHLSSVRGSVR